MDWILVEITAPELSAKIVIGARWFAQIISQRRFDSQIPSLEAVQSEISAPQEEKVTHPFFLERHDTGPPDIMKTNHYLDLRVEWKPF